MSDLPISESIQERPVWKRRQLRHYTFEPLDPPTQEEIHDAILILGDGDLQHEAADLWLEAERVHAEASR